MIGVDVGDEVGAVEEGDDVGVDDVGEEVGEGVGVVVGEDVGVGLDGVGAPGEVVGTIDRSSTRRASPAASLRPTTLRSTLEPVVSEV